MQLSAGLRQEFDNTLVKDRIVCERRTRRRGWSFPRGVGRLNRRQSNVYKSGSRFTKSYESGAKVSVLDVQDISTWFCKMNPPRASPRYHKKGFAPMPAGGIHLRSKLRRTVPSRLDIH